MGQSVGGGGTKRQGGTYMRDAVTLSLTFDIFVQPACVLRRERCLTDFSLTLAFRISSTLPHAPLLSSSAMDEEDYPAADPRSVLSLAVCPGVPSTLALQHHKHSLL